MQKDSTMNVQRSLEVETNLSLQCNKSDKGLINSLKALMMTIIDLKLLQAGDTVRLPQRIHLRHHAQSLRLFGLHRDVNDAHRAGANRLQNKTNNDGNQATTCGQLGAGIRGNLHPGVNSDFFFFTCSSDVISLAGFNLLAVDGEGEGGEVFAVHLPRTRFSHAQLLYSHLVTDFTH